MLRRVAICACIVLASLPTSFTYAQTLEDDDPNDTRYWGYSSQYQNQITNLGSTAPATFPIPVILGIEVDDLSQNFGDARGGGTRTHEGLDIVATQGLPVASPTDAVVVRTGNGVNSGLYVRTANRGGESFVFMHLSAIANGIEAGDAVKRGEVIGYVGNTGNASGGGAHLHFEVRKSGATDPFPRLTETFTLAERVAAAGQAVERSTDASLANTLAQRFRGLFNDAKQQGIPIPPAIEAVLTGGGSAVPAETSIVPPSKELLAYGERGAAVVRMQEVLIDANAGSASQRLKNTGATGFFGPLTREALVEYQRAKNLTPSGIVDDTTYRLIFTTAEVMPAETATPPQDTFTFTRDLEVGAIGDDVRLLQVFLNTHGFKLADTDLGSPGNETTKFGALTRAALSRYQEANSISPAIGYFGPITRGRINATR